MVSQNQRFFAPLEALVIERLMPLLMIVSRDRCLGYPLKAGHSMTSRTEHNDAFSLPGLW